MFTQSTVVAFGRQWGTHFM